MKRILSRHQKQILILAAVLGSILSVAKCTGETLYGYDGDTHYVTYRNAFESNPFDAIPHPIVWVKAVWHEFWWEDAWVMEVVDLKLTENMAHALFGKDDGTPVVHEHATESKRGVVQAIKDHPKTAIGVTAATIGTVYAVGDNNGWWSSGDDAPALSPLGPGATQVIINAQPGSCVFFNAGDSAFDDSQLNLCSDSSFDDGHNTTSTTGP